VVTEDRSLKAAEVPRAVAAAEAAARKHGRGASRGPDDQQAGPASALPSCGAESRRCDGLAISCHPESRDLIALKRRTFPCAPEVLAASPRDDIRATTT